jgi:hypothetical protein
VQAIILLDDPVERRGGALTHNHEDPKPVVVRLLEHATAIGRANDIPMAVLPTDANGVGVRRGDGR